MRRWFLARFYRLGFGSWFDPPTRYVDKAPVDSEVLGDGDYDDLLDGDLVLVSSPLEDQILALGPTADDVLVSAAVGVPSLQNEVDP